MKPTVTEAAESDLAEQARPGHGIPSQDPDPAAQFQRDPADAEREVQSMYRGGGAVAGVATGATIGAVVAGPAGLAVGAALGGVVGALCGAAAGVVYSRRRLSRGGL